MARFVQAIVKLIAWGLIFYLLFWLVGYLALPEPFSKVAHVVLAVAAVLACIDAIMHFIGTPLYHLPGWPNDPPCPPGPPCNPS